ncbi:hypothetical protein TNCV_4253051 [Trichonephila clavipes]|nr:hypothetical protein TNCV_4253051 [Trichonephila clavipes]
MSQVDLILLTFVPGKCPSSPEDEQEKQGLLIPPVQRSYHAGDFLKHGNAVRKTLDLLHCRDRPGLLAAYHWTKFDYTCVSNYSSLSSCFSNTFWAAAIARSFANRARLDSNKQKTNHLWNILI